MRHALIALLSIVTVAVAYANAECAVDFPTMEECTTVDADAAGCVFDYTAAVCTEKSCNHFYSESECTASDPSCTWWADGFKCLNPGETPSCSEIYDEPLCGDYNCDWFPESPEQQAFCYDSADPATFCDMIFVQSHCENDVSGCTWFGDEFSGACAVTGSDPPCWVYEESDCAAASDRCFWDSEMIECFEGQAPPEEFEPSPPSNPEDDPNYQPEEPQTHPPTPYPGYAEDSSGVQYYDDSIDGFQSTSTTDPIEGANEGEIPGWVSTTEDNGYGTIGGWVSTTEDNGYGTIGGWVSTTEDNDYGTIGGWVSTTEDNDYGTIPGFGFTTTLAPSATAAIGGLSITATVVIAACGLLVAVLVVSLLVKYKNRKIVRISPRRHALCEDGSSDLPRYISGNAWATRRLEAAEVIAV